MAFPEKEFLRSAQICMCVQGENVHKDLGQVIRKWFQRVPVLVDDQREFTMPPQSYDGHYRIAYSTTVFGKIYWFKALFWELPGSLNHIGHPFPWGIGLWQPPLLMYWNLVSTIHVSWIFCQLLKIWCTAHFGTLFIFRFILSDLLH